MPQSQTSDEAASSWSASSFLRSNWLRPLAAVIGAILLLAALLMVWRQREALIHAWNSVGHMSSERLAVLLAVLVGSVVMNLVLTGVIFQILIARAGRVGFLEMQALIAASTLLNYLPLRPGLLGRVAYHKAANQIPVKATLAVLMQAIAISAAVAMYAAGASMSAIHFGMDLRLLMLAPVPLLLGGFISRGKARAILLAGLARYVEIGVIAARYWAAFALIGSPLDGPQALAFACVSIIASMIPLVSNGLGLREWAVGLLAPVFTTYQMSLAMSADLLIRAAEIVIVTMAGCMGLAYLAKRGRRG